VTSEPRNGRIVTFYSYKGGTGRSMALANVGWILASTGLRVLLIDWDLEAPGLHRYLHPFIEEDKELSSTPGLIDFFVDFATAARIEHADGSGDERWFEAFASLVRYASPVRGGFESVPLEYVTAGRQDAGYAVLVTSFNWQEFYDKLGGGIFLEALKRRLRQDYDFVLIDSRTGISDTSGICTVQMPDDLVVLYTLNQQSIKGAAAIAESATRLRRRKTGEPGLRIWPIPTRVELAEKDRLDVAREESRRTFERYIGHLPRDVRSRYWGRIEVIYQPYFAYEEVLAPFADKPRQANSMLSKMEAIAGLLTTTPERPVEFPRLTEQRRLSVKKQFERGRSAGAGRGALKRRVYVSHSRADTRAVEQVLAHLRPLELDLWLDTDELGVDAAWKEQFDATIAVSDAVLVFIGGGAYPPFQEREVAIAEARGVRVIPVLVGGAGYDKLPPTLHHIQAARIDSSSATAFDQSAARLARELDVLLNQRDDAPATTIDPDDPQRGQWGESSERDGRALSASVRPLSDDYFEVTLTVVSTSDTPLAGIVEFNLHPSFTPSVCSVPVADGRAVLTLTCWGAFTVGAVADGGRTMLELDLAADTTFPETFTAR